MAIKYGTAANGKAWGTMRDGARRQSEQVRLRAAIAPSIGGDVDPFARGRHAIGHEPYGERRTDGGRTAAGPAPGLRVRGRRRLSRPGGLFGAPVSTPESRTTAPALSPCLWAALESS